MPNLSKKGLISLRLFIGCGLAASDSPKAWICDCLIKRRSASDNSSMLRRILTLLNPTGILALSMKRRHHAVTRNSLTRSLNLSGPKMDVASRAAAVIITTAVARHSRSTSSTSPGVLRSPRIDQADGASRNQG
ncbi:hypothetical protein T4A_8912, partial [Trichinella pseudospiralis]